MGIADGCSCYGLTFSSGPHHERPPGPANEQPVLKVFSLFKHLHFYWLTTSPLIPTYFTSLHFTSLPLHRTLLPLHFHFDDIIAAYSPLLGSHPDFCWRSLYDCWLNPNSCWLNTSICYIYIYHTLNPIFSSSIRIVHVEIPVFVEKNLVQLQVFAV